MKIRMKPADSGMEQEKGGPKWAAFFVGVSAGFDW